NVLSLTNSTPKGKCGRVEVAGAEFATSRGLQPGALQTPPRPPGCLLPSRTGPHPPGAAVAPLAIVPPVLRATGPFPARQPPGAASIRWQGAALPRPVFALLRFLAVPGRADDGTRRLAAADPPAAAGVGPDTRSAPSHPATPTPVLTPESHSGRARSVGLSRSGVCCGGTASAPGRRGKTSGSRALSARAHTW